MGMGTADIEQKLREEVGSGSLASQVTSSLLFHEYRSRPSPGRSKLPLTSWERNPRSLSQSLAFGNSDLLCDLWKAIELLGFKCHLGMI